MSHRKAGTRYTFSRPDHCGQTFTLVSPQARREPQRGPGNHYRGPYYNLIPLHAEIEASSGKKCGEGCLLTIQLVVWGHHKLPQQDPGQIPGRKWILCTFEARKKPSFEQWRAPQTSRGPGRLSPFSALSTGLYHLDLLSLSRSCNTLGITY